MILQNNQIEIATSGDPIYVYPLPGSQHYNELMGDEYIALKFSHTSLASIPLGSYVTYEGKTFELWQTPNIRKINDTNYEYDCVFHGLKDRLSYHVFVEQANDKTNCKTEFTMTAKPIEFIRMVIAAISERIGITVAEGIINAEDIEKTISFNNQSIREALDLIADTYSSEWNLYYSDGYIIDFGEVLYDDEELVLDYGEGNGIKSGVSITPENRPQIKRLWVQGGERNINYDTYLTYALAQYIGLTKSNRLILPFNADGYTPSLGDGMSTSIKYDVRKKLFGPFRYVRLCYRSDSSFTELAKDYEADYGFDETSEDVREYNLDTNGRFIERANSDAIYEQSFTNEEIYPSKVCNVYSCTITEGSGDDLGTFTITVRLKKYYTPNKTTNAFYIYNEDLGTMSNIGTLKLDTTVPLMIDTEDVYYITEAGVGYCVYARCYFGKTTYIGHNQYSYGYYDSAYVRFAYMPINIMKYNWTFDHNEDFPDYASLVAPGEKEVVVFQSGMLAGKEFEIQTIDDVPNVTIGDTYVTIVCLRQEVDNITMPEETTGYTAEEGDTFAVYGCLMPNSYLMDAEVNLLKSAVQYMAENEDQLYKFNGDLDSLWVQYHLSDKSKLLVPGQKVSNSDFSQSGMKITQVTTDLTDETNRNVSFSSGRKTETIGSRIKRLV